MLCLWQLLVYTSSVSGHSLPWGFIILVISCCNSSPFPVCRELRRPGKMGNAKSLSSQKVGSKFLPEEQAEVDRLFDVLSFNKGGSAAGTFSLEALKARATAW